MAAHFCEVRAMTICRRDSLTATGLHGARIALEAALGADVRVSGLAENDTVDLTMSAIGPVRITGIASSAEFRWDSPPLHQLAICESMTGTRRPDDLGHDGPGDRPRPGGVVVVAAPGQPIRGVASGPRSRIVGIDLDLLAEVAAIDPAQPRSVHRAFTDRPPVDPVTAERWRKAVDAVDGQVFPAEGGSAAPLIVHSAVRLLAATALTLFSGTASGEAGEIERCDTIPRTLRNALDFIEEHVADEITVADIAAAAQVTVRAVQLSFRQHLGMTPLQYVRSVRLARTHEELHVADPCAGDTVTDIAARWGFFSPGRFSAQYRERYGVSPSCTLRR